MKKALLAMALLSLTISGASAFADDGWDPVQQTADTLQGNNSSDNSWSANVYNAIQTAGQCVHAIPEQIQDTQY